MSKFRETCRDFAGTFSEHNLYRFKGETVCTVEIPAVRYDFCNYGKKSSSQLKPQMAAQALSITGCIPSLRCQSLFTRDSTAMFEWHLMGGKRLRLFMHTTRGQAFHVFAASNGSSAEGNPDKEIIMVDPLEAKRLAAKQMQEIKAKERFKKRRQIEAINGAWAIIGLTAGLVIEGHTGKSIVGQLAEYLRAIVRFFVR